jgi:hypothetical protein
MTIDKTDKKQCSRCKCYREEGDFISLRFNTKKLKICARCQIEKRNYRQKKKKEKSVMPVEVK